MAAQPGKYFGFVTGGILSESNNGTPQMAVTVSVEKHLQIMGNGQKEWVNLSSPMDVTMYLSFHDNAVEYTEKKLDTLGFNYNFDQPEFSLEVTQVDGIQLECRNESYNGKSVDRWDLANWGGPQKADKSTVDILNAKYRSRAKANVPDTSPSGGSPTSAPETAASPDTPSKDEITNKQDAWNFWTGVGNSDQNQWHEAIKDIGKPEEQFTADDWHKVAMAATPF